MHRIGAVLPAVLAKQPGRHRLAEMRVCMAFRELIGEPLASDCELVRLRGTALTVMTVNPALAHQLRLDSQLVLERLNAQRLGITVKSVHVRVGRSGFLADGA